MYNPQRKEKNIIKIVNLLNFKLVFLNFKLLYKTIKNVRKLKVPPKTCLSPLLVLKNVKGK